MITIASSARAIAVIRQELREVIAPLLSDPRASASMQMIDYTLRALETAHDSQFLWMREEITEIEQIGVSLVRENPKANAVRAALAALNAERAANASLESLRREYDLASEVLSCVIETVLGKAGPLLDATMALMSRRLAREVMIRGEFKIVGQS